MRMLISCGGLARRKHPTRMSGRAGTNRPALSLLTSILSRDNPFRFRPVNGGRFCAGSLASRFRQLKSRSSGSAADAEIVPQPKPGAVRQLFIVPSIGSRDIGRAEWPYVRGIEHFLQLLDFVN